MAANTVLNYLPRQSVVHKMTGTTKLAFFLLFTFASMITYNTWVLLGLMAVSFAAFKLSHIKLREVRFMLIFMLVFLLLNNLFIFLFDPNQGTTLYGTRHVLFHLFWRYDVTAEQLFYMVNISLKYFVALPVAILFISATNPSEFAASLNSIGISYKVGYSVAIALRYIPDIQRDYHSISQAQQARQSRRRGVGRDYQIHRPEGAAGEDAGDGAAGKPVRRKRIRSARGSRLCRWDPAARGVRAAFSGLQSRSLQ